MKDPTTLDEAVDYLVAYMSDDDKKAYAAGAPAPHFSLGMSLRNDWGLWFNETPLGKWFEANGIHHGDDRSGVIFDALRARLKGEPFDIKEQADYYRKWWKARYGIDHTQFGKTQSETDYEEPQIDPAPEVHPEDPDYPKHLKP
jgi:hypothetical protein